MSNSYTEDHLVEQPAIQFIRNELGWEVVNCYDEWTGGVSNQGRDGKREGGNIEHRTPNIERRSEETRKTWTNPALRRLNPDLPVEAIEGAVEEILKGAEKRKKVPCRRRFPDFTRIDDFTFC